MEEARGVTSIDVVFKNADGRALEFLIHVYALSMEYDVPVRITIKKGSAFLGIEFLPDLLKYAAENPDKILSALAALPNLIWGVRKLLHRDSNAKDNKRDDVTVINKSPNYARQEALGYLLQNRGSQNPRLVAERPISNGYFFLFVDNNGKHAFSILKNCEIYYENPSESPTPISDSEIEKRLKDMKEL